MIAAFLLAIQPPAAVSLSDFEARVARCGIAAERVQARFEPEIQYDMVFIGGSGVPSDETLACIADASAETGHIPRFTDPDAEARFGGVLSAALHRHMRSAAREWLRARGRLEALPRFDPQRETLDAYTARLEAFCGIAPGTAIPVEEGALSFPSPNGVIGLTDEQAMCFAHAVAASDSGITLGFVGNEAADR